MKKYFKIILLVLMFSLTLLFTTACGKEEEKDPFAYSNMDELLNLLEFNDQDITYDGKKHTMTYNGFRPDDAKIICTPNTSYIKPGSYTFTITVTWNGETAKKTANLNINKLQPEYLGQTEYNVYLNDGKTQPNPTFDMEGIEAINVPYYKEVGDYQYNLTTVETDIIASVVPTTITYHVFESKTGYTFPSQSFVSEDGEAYTLELEDNGHELASNLGIRYQNNSSNVQGYHQAIAQIYYLNSGEVYEEFHAILTIDYPTNALFEEYVNQTFVDYIEGDQLTINIFMQDYASFGVEHGEAKWYTFDGYDDYTEEDYQHDVQEIKDERQKFNDFKAQKLSMAQLISLRRIDEFIKFYEAILKDYEYEFIATAYIDQYGGNCADFPTDMEAYTLRTVEDIEDYISYFESTTDAFASYYDFIIAKKEKGYGFSRFTLEKYNEYLDGVVLAFKSKDGYYLTGVALKKLEDAKQLILDAGLDYDSYYNRLAQAAGPTLNASYADLNQKVTEFLETETYFDEEGFVDYYYGKSSKGKDYYLALLKNRLGIWNMSKEDYIKEVETYLKKYHDQFFAVYSQLTSYAEDIQDGKELVYDYGTDDDILNVFTFLKEYAATLVPALETEPEIGATWMDPTATANSTTTAYYMKSALDSLTNEYIHLNKRILKDNNFETVVTMAHEGYPGHLYAYVHTKENPNLSNFVKIATYTGHGEGWAKYVEYKFNDYLVEINRGGEHEQDFETLKLYNQSWEPFVFLVYARLDYGVNYEGWSVSKIGTFMKNNGLNSSGAEDIFHTLNESASQYPPYGYGQAVFINLHEQAQAALGGAYDEVEFNNLLLSNGWCSLDALKEHVKTYLDNKLFVMNK